MTELPAPIPFPDFIDFRWEIKEMRNIGGIVTQVYFEVFAVDTRTGTEQGNSGSMTLPQPEEGSAVIDYDALTEEKVIEWLDSHGSADYFKRVASDSLLGVVQNTGPTTSALPWAKD